MPRERRGPAPRPLVPWAACCRERDLEKCGDCQALDCAFLPEREGGPRAASRLAPLRREGLGGADRAAELGAGLRRLFWIWLGGDAAVYLAAGIASVLLAHGCTWVLRLIPGALELAVCLAMGRTLSRLGEAYRTVPPFLTAYGAVRAVSGAVSSLPVLAALTLLQGGLELVWIFRLYRANGALLERIGDRAGRPLAVPGPVGRGGGSGDMSDVRASALRGCLANAATLDVGGQPAHCGIRAGICAGDGASGGEAMRRGAVGGPLGPAVADGGDLPAAGHRALNGGGDVGCGPWHPCFP